MRTMIEILDDHGVDFFFVELFLVNDVLLILELKGVLKTFSLEVPLEKMHVTEHSGLQYGGRFTFVFKNKTYSIVDYGNGVLKYLQIYKSTGEVFLGSRQLLVKR